MGILKRENNFVKDVEKSEPVHRWCECKNGAAALEKSMEVPQKN